MIEAKPHPSVAEFFHQVVPFLAGQTTCEALTEQLGPSCSPPQRLLFYQRLMAANVRRILRAVFPVIAEIIASPERVGLASVTSWERLSAEFVAAHPTAHWRPNALGAAFPEYLETRADLPRGLADLANWCLQLLAARTAETGVGRLAPGVSAAHYRFDVAKLLARLADAKSDKELAVSPSAAVAELPPPQLAVAIVGPPIVLVVHRVASGEIRVLRPDPFEVAALALASGEVDRDALGAIPADRLARASDRLSELGLIIPGARA